MKDRFELMEFREASAPSRRCVIKDGQGRHHGRWRGKRTRCYYASANRTEHAAYREPGLQEDVRRKYGLADFLEEPARPEGDEAEGAQGDGAASGPVSSETFTEVELDGLDDVECPEASVPDEAAKRPRLRSS